MNNKRLLILLIVPALLLLVPAIAMLFTDEVNWSVSDFIIMGVLLYSTAFVCEIILRFSKNTSVKIVLCSVAVLLLLLIWAELAVGIFGSRFAGS